jgi:ketosteroid isomerase-like protein
VVDKVEDQQERTRIESVIDAELESIADDEIDRLLTLLAEDALFLPPDLPSIGGEELHAWLREFLEQWRVEWLGYRHNETEIRGDLAFHRFSYSWLWSPRAAASCRFRTARACTSCAAPPTVIGRSPVRPGMPVRHRTPSSTGRVSFGDRSRSRRLRTGRISP